MSVEYEFIVAWKKQPVRRKVFYGSPITYILESKLKQLTKIGTFSGAKEEILANLANFAYDPINYDHFRKLNVVDLFMGKDNSIIWYLFSFS